MTNNANIVPSLARALDIKGYAELTEVQSAVLTDEAAGRDMLVSAQTGSGKTVAFGLAMAPELLGDKDQFDFAGSPLALVIAPTRELALQVQRELQWLYGEAKARIASCVGGMDPRSERKALERGCHIVVGTPGRLRDHIERGALDLSDARAVVLDEADEMLDFGFEEDLEFILNQSPDGRRTLLFSATVPHGIARLAKKYQNDAMRLETAGEKEQHGDISYQVMTVQAPDRENAIVNILRFNDAQRAIVFCATREGVSRLASKLGNRGFAAVALSGELSQKERSHALQAMRDGRARVCIATDVAARGIDLPGLELVIHADLPTNAETLKHRSGRTGRAGNKGICALIVPYSRTGRARALLRNGGIEADWIAPPSAEAILEKDRARILADTALTDEVEPELLEDAKALLESFGAEQVAAAFIRAQMKGMPAPEELMAAPQPKTKSERDNFEHGGWFKLNTGRKHGAEPRWLLPLVCRAGDVTKRDIGSIRIREEDSWVQISAKGLEQFKSGLEASGGGEKNVRIVETDEEPPAREKRAFQERPRRDRDGDGERRERGDRPHRENRDRGDRGSRDRDDRNRDDRNRSERDDRRPDNRDRKDWNDRPRRPRDEERSFDKPRKPRPPRDDRPRDKDRGERRPADENVSLDELLGDQDNRPAWNDRDNRKPRRDNRPTDGKKRDFKRRDDREFKSDDRSDEPRRKMKDPRTPKGKKPFGAKGGSKGPTGGFKKKRDFRDGAPGPEDRPRRRATTGSGKPGSKGGPKGASLRKAPRKPRS
ncbi:MAG: DEAD/DEAH box helicase [Maricaulis sp.]|nr:DEAD/DEAH box helicase [Maricaulis sp.]